MNQTPLYPYSAEEAGKRGELPLWRASHHANVACRNAIEEAVRQHFDGSYLENNCLDDVLKEYGYERTTWVLANTIQQKDWDGRFSDQNEPSVGQKHSHSPGQAAQLGIRGIQPSCGTGRRGKPVSQDLPDPEQ